MRRSLNDPMRQLTLCHDLSDLEVPAKLYELTPDLLRQLYDQVVHYGFTDAPMDPTRILFLPVNGTLVKITVLLSDEIFRMNFGTSNKDTYYIFSPKYLIIWRSEICVADIARAANELDKKMAKRGYFDEQTGERADVLDGGQYYVAEAFPQKYLFYILPGELKTDPTQVFDRPELLSVLQLHGKSVLCRTSEAELVRKVYKPLSIDDLVKAGKNLLQGVRAQVSLSRHN